MPPKKGKGKGGGVPHVDVPPPPSLTLLPLPESLAAQTAALLVQYDDPDGHYGVQAAPRAPNGEDLEWQYVEATPLPDYPRQRLVRVPLEGPVLLRCGTDTELQAKAGLELPYKVHWYGRVLGPVMLEVPMPAAPEVVVEARGDFLPPKVKLQVRLKDTPADFANPLCAPKWVQFAYRAVIPSLPTQGSTDVVKTTREVVTDASELTKAHFPNSPKQLEYFLASAPYGATIAAKCRVGTDAKWSAWGPEGVETVVRLPAPKPRFGASISVTSRTSSMATVQFPAFEVPSELLTVVQYRISAGRMVMTAAEEEADTKGAAEEGLASQAGSQGPEDDLDDYDLMQFQFGGPKTLGGEAIESQEEPLPLGDVDWEAAHIDAILDKPADGHLVEHVLQRLQARTHYVIRVEARYPYVGDPGFGSSLDSEVVLTRELEQDQQPPRAPVAQFGEPPMLGSEEQGVLTAEGGGETMLSALKKLSAGEKAQQDDRPCQAPQPTPF
jgi:hypothetical protein